MPVPVKPRSNEPALRLAAAILAVSMLIAIGASLSETAAASQDQPLPSCAEAGRWVDLRTGETARADVLLARQSGRAIVLLGESHTAREHHLWQTHTLAGLHAHHPGIVIGFEMFPRDAQPVLDRWSAGALSRRDFLQQTRWDTVWGYDADLYMPLFDFARQHRLPMVALNVDRALVARVSREGWSAIPKEAREDINDPAPASEAYRLALARVFAAKSRHRPGGKEKSEAPDDAATDLDAIMARDDFNRFVEAQLTWDRAMAEALASASKENTDALIVGILGRGHIEHGHGVPHQLADLGIDDVAILLPVQAGKPCEALPAGIADAVFLVDAPAGAAPAPAKPKLGVMIETAEDGVRILKVIDASVAQDASLAAGDVVFEAAGISVKRTADLVRIIRRQAPGTWLPLQIRRDDAEMSVIAKFPPEAGAAE